MTEMEAAYYNGFNSCIERSLGAVDEVANGSYTISMSPAQLLLLVKQKILTMHILGEDREAHARIKERN